MLAKCKGTVITNFRGEIVAVAEYTQLRQYNSRMNSLGEKYNFDIQDLSEYQK